MMKKKKMISNHTVTCNLAVTLGGWNEGRHGISEALPVSAVLVTC